MNLSQLTGRESVPGPLGPKVLRGLSVTRFLSTATVAGALAGPMLTALGLQLFEPGSAINRDLRPFSTGSTSDLGIGSCGRFRLNFA